MDFTRLTEYLDSLESHYGVPQTDVIVTKDQEIVYRHQTGFSDEAGTLPTSDEDLYWYYSCTKVMTQVGIMQLIEQGKLGLYDPVSAYLPEFAHMRVYNTDHMGEASYSMPEIHEPTHFAKNPIRIIDLMSMMAGLSYNMHSAPIVKCIEETKGHGTTRDIVKAIAASPLLYEPGTRLLYSLAHDVLACVIEEVSGEKYSDYLTNHVFTPVGADHLYFLPDDEKKKHISMIYRYDMETGKMVPTTSNGLALTDRYESGGGGLCGAASSYSKVLQALANGGVASNGNRILSEDSVMMFTTEVTTGQALEDFVKMRKGPYAYGLGVRVKHTMNQGKSPIGEFGWDGAAGAYALIDPFNKISITYVHHIMGFEAVYQEIHPTVRDLVYEIMGY